MGSLICFNICLSIDYFANRIMKGTFSFKTIHILLFCFLALICFCCGKEEPSKTKVIFHIHHAYGHKVFLQTVPYTDEKPVTVDSATVKSGNDIIELFIPKGEERPYRVRIFESRIDILVINDSPAITVEANIFKPSEYTVKNSKATQSVKSFLDDQLKLSFKGRSDAAKIDSLKLKNAPKATMDSLTNEYNKGVANFFTQYTNYADTVSSPAAFLYIYNNVDFGNDRQGLKNFISKAAQRFPDNGEIQKLKQKTLEYLKIFELEYRVGDYLPELVLPDRNGNNFSTYFAKGKYVFMDFWSTWCGACLKYDQAKATAKKVFPGDKFEIVSIALDSEKDTWRRYIEANKLNWVQLIDEKMWRGPTVKAYSIDSIPFNFLLAPDGRVLLKAIKSDSVMSVLSKLIR
jgi:thiol-disulfide isomerase/thioredoxin